MDVIQTPLERFIASKSNIKLLERAHYATIIVSIQRLGVSIQPRPGLLFHMDLKTVRTRSINHQHYLVDIINDNSGLRRKSDTLLDALCIFYDTVCRPRGINFFALRMDNAGELVSHEVHEFCATHGIHLVPVSAYLHAWSRVAERFFDTLFCMIRSMIETSHLPGFYSELCCSACLSSL